MPVVSLIVISLLTTTARRFLSREPSSPILITTNSCIGFICEVLLVYAEVAEYNVLGRIIVQAGVDIAGLGLRVVVVGLRLADLAEFGHFGLLLLS